MTSKTSSNLKAMPIFLAFLCMGFADVVGPLVSLAKDTFNLSNFLAQLLPFSGFLMFGIWLGHFAFFANEPDFRPILLWLPPGLRVRAVDRGCRKDLAHRGIESMEVDPAVQIG